MSESNGMPSMPDQLPEEVVQTWLDQADQMRTHEWVRVRGRDIGAVMDEFRELIEGDREVITRRQQDTTYIDCLEARVQELRTNLGFVRGTRDRAMREIDRLLEILRQHGISSGPPEGLHPDENLG